MGKHIKGLIILAVLATAGLLVPGIGAVFPGGHDAWPIDTRPELNVTSVNITNLSIPAMTPSSLIRVEVAISDTPLPAQKGEMAAGPRTIGFSSEPLTLATWGVVIIAGAAGVWYLVKRKPKEQDEEGEDDK